MTPWRRNLHVTVVMVFTVFTAFAFVLPFLPLYVRQLGVAGEQRVALWSGVLIGVAPLLAGLLAPLWGRLADRHGHKRMAVRALFSYVVLLLLSACVTDVWQLLATRVGVGLFGGIGPLGLAMATALAPREETGRAVGQVQAAQILSAAVGPLMGGLLADSIGIRLTFVVTAGICMLALALMVFWYREPERAASGADPQVSFGQVLRLPHMAAMLLALFVVNFVGRSFTPILPLHLQDLGVSATGLASSTGLLISVYSIAAAVSATLLGRATRTRPPRQLLTMTLVLGALIVLPMAWVARFGPLLGLAVLLGLASGGSLTLCYTIGGLLAGPARKGTAFGIFAAAALFGGSVSPSVAGLLAGWNLRGIYYLDAALLLVLAGALLAGALPPLRATAAAGQEPEAVAPPSQARSA
jgi:MFS transporter, DHA1 family, multidrug resistance protein